MKNRTLASQPANLGTKRVEFTGLVAPGNYHAISPAEILWSFTKPAVRKQLSAAPRISRIDCDHVEIARNPQMLKPVVQNKTVCAEILYRFLPCRYSIGAANHG